MAAALINKIFQIDQHVIAWPSAQEYSTLAQRQMHGIITLFSQTVFCGTFGYR
jgi:hypothetical protein